MRGIKKLFLSSVMVVIAAAAVVPAHAQEDRLSVNVPFDFELGKSTLRNGQYHVEKQPSGIVVFTSLDGNHRSYAVLTLGGQTRNGTEPYLVFTRYGNDSFLSQIVFSAYDNYKVQKTDREKELIAKALLN